MSHLSSSFPLELKSSEATQPVQRLVILILLHGICENAGKIELRLMDASSEKGPVRGEIQTSQPASCWLLESDDLKKHALLSKT